MAPTATLRDGERGHFWPGFLVEVVLWKSTTTVSESLLQPKGRRAIDKRRATDLRKEKIGNRFAFDPKFMNSSGSGETVSKCRGN
jgi:hypothetical protein